MNRQFSHKEIEEIFEKIHDLDTDLIDRVSPFLDGLYKYYFRCKVHGWYNVPKEKAVFVGNHNGLITWEVMMLFYGWWKKYGYKKRAVGLAHDIVARNALFSWLLPKLGAVPAHPEVAFTALQKDYSLLVFPGGLKEAYRPYKEKTKINFYERKGFIKLALRAQVPIVPVISVGAHETYIILNRGEMIAEKLGIKKKFRIDGVPITYRSLFFAWCVGSGLLTFFPLLLAPAAFSSIFVPLPAKMDFFILPPIDVCSLMNSKLSEEENLKKIYKIVTGEMQKAMEREYKKRKRIILG